jgi:4-aminobutyrate aminotransferase
MRCRVPVVGDVRGIGLLLGVELVDPASGAPARDLAERVLYECLSSGLSFKVGQGNVLVLSPPLVIGEADLDRALDVVEQAIVKCSR